MNFQTSPTLGFKERQLPFECVALVLQGGGALGAYQTGVLPCVRPVGAVMRFPTRSRHASFTSIFPKFSPLKSLRKALGAFSMPSSTLSFHTSLPSRIHPDRSRWNSGRRLK